MILEYERSSWLLNANSASTYWWTLADSGGHWRTVRTGGLADLPTGAGSSWWTLADWRNRVARVCQSHARYLAESTGGHWQTLADTGGHWQTNCWQTAGDLATSGVLLATFTGGLADRGSSYRTFCMQTSVTTTEDYVILFYDTSREFAVISGIF